MNARKVISDLYRAERSIPFAWGTADCLRFAAKCAEAITGRDPAAGIGRYDSEQTAKRVMVAEGWRDMGDVADSMFDEIPVSLARSGDWVQVVQGETDGLGVVVGATVAIKTQNGVGQVPLSSASRAFRVT